MKKSLNALKSQLYILQARSVDLDQEIDIESILYEKICRATPVKLNSTNFNEDLTKLAIKSCYDELKNFYQEFDLNQVDGEFES